MRSDFSLTSIHTIAVSFLYCMESKLCVFLSDGAQHAVFLLCGHGLDFDIISLVRGTINQQKLNRA